ncbi:tyrosine-type recombinase/integrase [Alloalcanivorax xenomutans]|jgi:integrase|uniref:tyrosine-type recombinase/integrase n=1 Tax=Gammaproteobacteria TaxID=1236 RepID=UPI0007A75CB8|nr:integrase arm-type DNA-binding domain-containing protein [Alloalcanivorax xenomutans]KYZ86630.1 integrase [Alcanivorax sp. KX64203]MAD71285.1 integrase [Alcanivorax sp.]MDX1499463.1 integrase arm-type DNA-binding domain-containing protein [Woeseiaceae bacterium]MAO60182.1 integrase [Alcanivorax sp.]MAY08940.1 integrase [Alcanivorax sp.]|tara:strand:+ start:420 stop:1688 length:1269 start_codon:yes stop_codon:yes gene_type:complete
MAMNLLSARKVETTSHQSQPFWLKDGGSLFLYVTPAGNKLWRFRYRIGGKPAIYAIGKYPEVSLEAARVERDRARDLVNQGIHPVVEKRTRVSVQIEVNETTFESVARRWMVSNVQWSEGYADQVKKYLEKDVFPKVGNLPISSIRPAHLRPLIQGVAERGAPTVAILIRQWCSQLFAYASAEDLCDQDPTALLKRSVKRPRVRHNPPLPWNEIPDFLNKVDESGYRATVIALRLMALTYVRTAELRKAKWTEFDLKNAIWTVPAGRMKMRQPHIVPLSKQAIELLEELQKLTGGGEFLFPSFRKPGQVISATTLNKALERMGYLGRFSSHGFRATATTLLGLLSYPENRVDLQLAHSRRKKDSSRAPYDHTKYIASRKIIMQDWADILDALARGDSMDKVMEDFGPLSERRTALLRVTERE